MKKPIGVDFDDVIADSHEPFLQFLNRYYQTQIAKEEITEFAVEKWLKVTKDEVMQHWMKFSRENHVIAPRPGAHAMLARLADRYELHIITNRPTSMRETSEQWIAEHFPGIFSELHFCSSRKTMRTFRTKSSVLKRLGAHILLEDHPDTAHACASDGIHVYVFDQPWNRQDFPLLTGALVRVQDWQDAILETLLK